MTQPPGHVELVIRTASSLLVGRLGPREAVTILATQTPRALARAAELARDHPDQALNFATLVRSLDAALADQSHVGHDAHDAAAVRQDLAALAKALEGE